jgi:hypothetical protein
MNIIVISSERLLIAAKSIYAKYAKYAKRRHFSSVLAGIYIHIAC